MDHKSIIYLFSQPKLSGRQARWIEELSEFDLSVEYKSGCSNIVADALSRRPDYEVNSVSQLLPDESFLKDIRNAYSEYMFFEPIIKHLENLNETMELSTVSVLSYS